MSSTDNLLIDARKGEGRTLEVWTHEGLRFLTDQYSLYTTIVVLEKPVQASRGNQLTALAEGNRVILPLTSVARMVEHDPAA